MFQTRVTLGNIYRVLLNLTKTIFYLGHQLRSLLTLNFVPLPYLFG